MKKFLKNLLKFVLTVSSAAAVAVLIYRFCKKYVTIEHGKNVGSDTTDKSTDADSTESVEGAKPVNRRYVNIVLDWDQSKEEASPDIQKEETDSNVSSQSLDEEAETSKEKEAASDTEKEASGEADEQTPDEADVSDDSSIHLD